MHVDAEVLPQRLDQAPRQAVALPLRALEPALAHAERHPGADEQARGDREALEVLGLARVVLGDEGDGRVEAREAGNARADEERQEGRVDRGAQAERPGDKGRGDAERDLCRGGKEAGVSDGLLDRLCTRVPPAPLRAQVAASLRQTTQRTESARLSSSCPSMLLSRLHRATLPSRASKIMPRSGNARARLSGFRDSARSPVEEHLTRRERGGAHQRKRCSFVRRYSADEKSERAPQKPLPSVTQSARRKFLCVGESSGWSVRHSLKTSEGREATHLTSEKWRSSWTNSLSFAVSSFFLAAAAVLLVGFSSAALRDWSIEVLSRRAARAFAAESGWSRGAEALGLAWAGAPVTGGVVSSAAVPVVQREREECQSSWERETRGR